MEIEQFYASGYNGSKRFTQSDVPTANATGFGTVAANNWFLFTTGWNLLGDWSTSPTGLQSGQSGYRVGNVVRNGAYTYVCILDHTPSGANQPPNTTSVFVDEPEDYKKWVAEQKPFLATNPGFLEKVPANLKAKASKYIPTEPIATDSAATVSVN